MRAKGFYGASNSDSFSRLIRMFWTDVEIKWLLFTFIFKYGWSELRLKTIYNRRHCAHLPVFQLVIFTPITLCTSHEFSEAMYKHFGHSFRLEARTTVLVHIPSTHTIDAYIASSTIVIHRVAIFIPPLSLTTDPPALAFGLLQKYLFFGSLPIMNIHFLYSVHRESI